MGDLQNLTPMMNQYLNIKGDYPEAILLFRLGDFYEMFFEDAQVASKALEITLTSREGGKGRRVPMCGVPHHAVDSYIARLIKSGFKVAICDQVEDPKLSKGIVRREIIRVITPGSLTEPNLLEEKVNNFIVSFVLSEKKIGAALVDFSTGEFKIAEFGNAEDFLDELERINPAEILIPENFTSPELIERIKKRNSRLVTPYQEWVFFYETAYEALLGHFKTRNLAGFGVEGCKLGIGAAGGLLRYLEELRKTDLLHLTRLSLYSPSEFLAVDIDSRRSLELTRNLSGEKSGTLLSVLDDTQTAMGGRLLVNWIEQPLLKLEEIRKRQDGLENLMEDKSLGEGLTGTLKGIGDLERLIARVSLGTANGRDLLNLGNTLKRIPVLKKILGNSQAGILEEIDKKLIPLSQITDLIDKAVVENPPLSLRDGGLIKDGYNGELDELRNITGQGKDWLVNLQKQERKRTGISSLKVRYNRVFGYYIEVTKANLGLVPEDYIRKQTLVNAERFIIPVLKEYEAKILSAEEKILELEFRLFNEVRQIVAKDVLSIQQLAGQLAVLDVLSNLARVSLAKNYTRPELNESRTISIKEGSHPVLEDLLGSNKFVPNPVLLDKDSNQILIITGPNMAGKSTYIRQAALLVLMAQMGCFIPAREAKIGLVDRILTRIGTADNLSRGMSTFMVEMCQTANILNNLTGRSFVILDEIGRGTSTFDGLSIAWAVVEYLHKLEDKRPLTLFATHYHELTELSLTLDRVKNFNIAVREWNKEVIFLFKLTEGSTDHSYGIHVARLAGLPGLVVERAEEILNTLEINSVDSGGTPKLADSSGSHREFQLGLFDWKMPHPLIEELKDLPLEKMTPIEALNKIIEWQGKCRENSP